MIEQKYHIPAMLNEVLDCLNLRPGKVIVDATVGTGGHSRRILESIVPDGRLIGIDRDKESLTAAAERLSDYEGFTDLIYGNFVDVDRIAADLNIGSVDGILFDLGISTVQMNDPQRGFSFRNDGPLDMRMDRNSFISAYDLVNNLDEEELSNLIKDFGEERFHNRIARFLARERQTHPISTTAELSDIVVRAIPYRYRHYRIHPATRTFQAVRIAVNRELEILETALMKAVDLLNKRGRICVISFHSLEDRIVKFTFRSLAAKGILKIITAKPLIPQDAEIKRNPSSRSAKLRAAEKV